MVGPARTLVFGAALLALGAGAAHAQIEQPAKATTGGGGESSGGGIRHFSATGLGMAVGRAQGGGYTARHGFLVGGAASQSDRIPPEIDPPDDIVQSTDRDQCRGTVDIPAIDVDDNRDRDPRVTVTILADPPIDVDPTGEQIELDIGSYDVLIEAEDRAGNTSQATFRIDVIDLAPPIFVDVPDPTPNGQEIEALSPAGTVVEVNGSCRDACDPAPRLVYEPAQARYPVGDTGVIARCTDRNGNSIESPFTVRVRDTTPPELAGVLDDVAVECDSPRGTEIDLPRVLFSDNGTPTPDLGLALVVNPGQAGERVLMPIPETIVLDRGRHVLRYTATDTAGNTLTADLNVDIIDNGVPQLRVIDAPDGGWSNAGAVNIVLEITDGCSDEDAPLDIDIAPPPGAIDRDGNRVTVSYAGEGLYELEILVTDEDGNTTRDNSVAFGIDVTAPQAIIRVPSQLDVDAGDDGTWPLFARAERLPVDFGGEDAGDGATAGVRSVDVIFDPDNAGRVIAAMEYDGDGNPARGQRLVAGVGCEEELDRAGAGVPRDDNYCDADTQFDIRYLEPGVHVVEVVVTDFAGNIGTGRGYFATADLHAGTRRIIADLGGQLGNLNAAAVGPTRAALAALARARDASDARIADTPFDSSMFLGAALRASQTATIQLLAAIDVADNDQGQRDNLEYAVRLLQRVSRSDVVLLAAHVDSRIPAGQRPFYLRDAEDVDLAFYADFIGLVDENLDNEEYTTAASNVQSAYFHAKSALEGWVMDYDLVPDQAQPLLIRREYSYASSILTSMTSEMDRYLNEGLVGANEVADIRASLVSVIDALDTIIEFGFDQGDGVGQSDQRYVEELIELRATANQSKLAGNNGVWVRNFQWSMMQIVRFMVHASIEDAILNRGQGRRQWPLYATGLDLIAEGVGLLDDRRIQTVIDLYGVNEDSICLLIASYHCDFLDDEDNDEDRPIAEANVPAFCWDRMWRPREWAMVPPNNGIPAQCQYGEQVER